MPDGSKSNRITTVFGMVLALALVGFVAWLIVKGVEHEPGIVGSLVTAAAAVAAVVAGQYWSKRLDLRQQHRDRMAPIYEELVDRTRGEPGSGSDQFWKDMQKQLILYGPAPVLRAFLQWRENFNEDEEEGDPRNILSWGSVLRAIRRDLGHNDNDLRPHDLLRIYVNDLDEAIAAWEVKQSQLAARAIAPPPG